MRSSAPTERSQSSSGCESRSMERSPFRRIWVLPSSRDCQHRHRQLECRCRMINCPLHRRQRLLYSRQGTPAMLGHSWSEPRIKRATRPARQTRRRPKTISRPPSRLARSVTTSLHVCLSSPRRCSPLGSAPFAAPSAEGTRAYTHPPMRFNQPYLNHPHAGGLHVAQLSHPPTRPGNLRRVQAFSALALP